MAYLTTAEVADKYGVSRTTVLRWVEERKVVPLRLGERTLRFTPQALRDLDERASEPPLDPPEPPGPPWKNKVPPSVLRARRSQAAERAPRRPHVPRGRRAVPPSG